MSKSISERRDGPLLECRGVTKRFGALVAVNRLSFELHRGEILGIGGPNGAGKTTLFDVISGFVPADEGTVSHEGHRIERMQTHAICHLGLARTFQLNAAFTTLTVFENVLAATCFGQSHTLLSSVRLNKTAVETTHELLDFAGLTERRGEPAGSLPVVDRKRLMVAAALATGPQEKSGKGARRKSSQAESRNSHSRAALKTRRPPLRRSVLLGCVHSHWRSGLTSLGSITERRIRAQRW